MIINTGQRTDIPAFYSEWFYNRIKEGFVYVRNPYYPSKVTKYILDPSIVDCICFCTKNPIPMMKRLNEINNYRQFWFVTITPYLKDIEPNVPHFNKIINAFKILSNKLGSKCTVWRYDPIFINDKYTIEFHLKAFEYMCYQLSGYTKMCVISFIDLYKKTKNNFPDIKEVDISLQHYLIKKFVDIAQRYNINIYTCLENKDFAKYGVNVNGCMTKEILEDALNIQLKIDRGYSRKGCFCLLGNDIGAYNSCLHGCLYCYANTEKRSVISNYRLHNCHSPMLIGSLKKDDLLLEANHKSDIDYQLKFDI